MFVIGTSSTSSQGVLYLDGGTDAVGIGTHNIPAGFKLAVDGKAICEELRVELSGSWPDYVFDEGYRLPTLDEYAGMIKEKRHLPGIPPAAHIEKHGLDVGDMQQRMMEKIEEMALYIIQLHEENKAIKAELETLKNNSYATK